MKKFNQTLYYAPLYLFVYLLYLFILLFKFIFQLINFIKILINKTERTLIDYIFKNFGTKTTGTVIESRTYFHDGDDCVCGIYSFIDSRGKERRGKFRICFHYPYDGSWKLVIEGYYLNVKNPVLYLKYFSRIHEMQFPI